MGREGQEHGAALIGQATKDLAIIYLPNTTPPVLG